MTGKYPLESVMELSVVQRAAHFLDWCAKNSPGNFQAHATVWQAITGIARRPSSKDANVKTLRGRSGAIREILFVSFQRELISLPGSGWRASVDDTDRVENVMPGKKKKLASATNSYVRSGEAINIRNVLANTPERKRLKADFIANGVNGLLKTLTSPKTQEQLKPLPALTDGMQNEGEKYTE